MHANHFTIHTWQLVVVQLLVFNFLIIIDATKLFKSTK